MLRGNLPTQQDGGTNSVTWRLFLGYNVGSEGNYQLNGGSLSSDYEYVGNYGTAEFVQTGGTNTLAHTLYIAYANNSDASYEISGGSLTAYDLVVGYAGAATFKVTADSAIITIDNNYKQNSMSSLISEIDVTGISLIDIAGTATLDGTWTVTDLGAGFGRFDILEATGGISGAFDTINLPGADWVWGIDNGVTLWVQHVPEPTSVCFLVLAVSALYIRKR